MTPLQNSSSSQSLPKETLFGTSSWTYRGWQGTVYFDSYKTEKDFNANCLREYVKYPWFRTVGIDSTFYAPPKVDTLLHYADLLPPSFQWVSKVWQEITIPVFAKLKQFGPKAGTVNQNFLHADLFVDKVLTPYETAGIKPHTGPFVFQFQSFGRSLTKSAQDFLEKLDSFLSYIPKTYKYAIEIRDMALLNIDYFAILNKHNVTHCFNHWTNMPSLKEQMKKASDAGGLSAPFFVVRLLTPRGLNYERAVDKFQPYDSIKLPNEEMRHDVVRLLKRAIIRKIPAFVLVNNRCEGHAPGTIKAIGEALLNELPSDSLIKGDA